jgi:hypothetical protein
MDLVASEAFAIHGEHKSIVSINNIKREQSVQLPA